jgi:hypothetical protein
VGNSVVEDSDDGSDDAPACLAGWSSLGLRKGSLYYEVLSAIPDLEGLGALV